MEDTKHVKFILTKKNYAGIISEVRGLDKEHSTSERGGLEFLMFSDRTEINFPQQRKRGMMMNIKYYGKHIPDYLKPVTKDLKRIPSIRV